jgi:1-deoxy-D-xylulose-5-phosphate reductoisomerase
MGRVVTTNSATLVNKGLEGPNEIGRRMSGGDACAIVEPSTNSTIECTIDCGCTTMDWTTAQSWTFEPLDDEAFPAVALAKRVGRAGGTYPAVFNGARPRRASAG